MKYFVCLILDCRNHTLWLRDIWFIGPHVLIACSWIAWFAWLDCLMLDCVICMFALSGFWSHDLYVWTLYAFVCIDLMFWFFDCNGQEYFVYRTDRILFKLSLYFKFVTFLNYYRIHSNVWLLGFWLVGDEVNTNDHKSWIRSKKGNINWYYHFW